jgi:hypothetical protein
MLHIIVYTRVPRITTHVTTRVELLFCHRSSIVPSSIVHVPLTAQNVLVNIVNRCLSSSLLFAFSHHHCCFLTPTTTSTVARITTTAYHCLPLLTTAYHCLPLLTTAYHCYQLATTSSLLPLQNHDGYNKTTTHPPTFFFVAF